MELFLYIFLLLLGSLLALTKQQAQYGASEFFLWLFSCLSLACVVRFSNFDVDIATYADSMLWDKVNFYILREPAIWLSLRYLYQLTGSQIGTFLILDTALFLFLFFFWKKMKLPYYALFGLITFFPMILGFQNVYRQFAATIFLLGALAYIRENSAKGLLLFFLAASCHNVALLFIPVLIYFRRGPGHKAISYLTALAIIVAMGLLKHTKSGVSTGLPMEQAYFAILLTLIFFILGIYQLKLNYKNRFDIQLLLIFLIIQGGAILVLASAPAERIGMLSLVLIYPMIINLIETKFKNKFELRLAVIFLGFLPILIFSSTRTFLI